jgi:ketosteroid isomerase-like protein
MRIPSSKMTPLSILGRATAALALSASLSLPAWAQVQASGAMPSASPEVAEIQRLIRSGQNSQALKLIDDALAKNPKDPSMRFRRGVTLSMLDRKAEALVVFQKLVEDHPDMPSPYNNLAVIYGSQGDYDKARAALEKAIRTNPAYATAYQNLGDVYAQLASQAYSKALQLDKSDTTVPPKLALLRELVTTPPVTTTPIVETAPVAAAPAPHPTQVAVATPAPAPSIKPTPAPAAPTVHAAPVAPARAPVASIKPPAPAPTPAPALAPAPTPATTAKPAATPAPVTIAALKPEPAPTPQSANAVADVSAAVHAWASSWSRRDMAGYLGAYTPEFTGSAKSHKAWEDDRKARILPRKRIAVEVSDLRVSVNGDKAEVHFKQTYESDTLSTVGHKTLYLVRSPTGKWLIRQESVGG